MENNLKIKGTQNINGQAIKVIEGGFGEGQKCMLAKTIAELHDMRLDKINALINSNRDEFEDGVDILDIKNSNLWEVSLLEFGFTKQAIANSTNIYLLSEEGYMLLVGFMKTDKAKAIRKQLRREYFQMRKTIKAINPENATIDALIGTLQEVKTLQNKLNTIDNRTFRIEHEIDSLPLLTADSNELTTVAKRKIVSLLGGKGAPAYKMFNRKAFSDLYHELHRQFDVNKICAIKRKDLEQAKKIIIDYMLPIKLRNDVEVANRQIVMVV